MCKANAMNWLGEAVKVEDERKKRPACWDALAGQLCATRWRYGDDYERLVGRPLDFTRPAWDPGGSEPSIERTIVARWRRILWTAVTG